MIAELGSILIPWAVIDMPTKKCLNKDFFRGLKLVDDTRFEPVI